MFFTSLQNCVGAEYSGILRIVQILAGRKKEKRKKKREKETKFIIAI